MNKFGKFDIQPKTKWYNEYPKENFPCKHSFSVVDVLNLKEQAKKYLEGEAAAFQIKQLKIKDSESEWLRRASTEGTHADKTAATIILIQDNPKYNLTRLSNLISQIKGLKHNVSNSLITSLRDLFLSDLLHPQYKLLKFEEQPLDSLKLSNENGFLTKDTRIKNILAHWYFEDQLRDQYKKFLLALSTVASDSVDVVRENAISILADLLISNSEQEHKLLECLVNKIGDPHARVASKAVFCLNKVLKNHSNMKFVILKEVEKLLFRPNIAQRTQYYGICLLNHFILNKEDTETATNLINLYFAFFKASMKKGEPDSRMMAAILSGVNRSYRFANLDNVKLNDHINSVYKVIHNGSFNVSLSAMSLLHQVIGDNSDQARRFYAVLYRQLLDPQIGIAHQRAIFLNLLFKVMKNDKNTIRLYTFVKRILQVSLYFPACMICAILYVISQILNIRNDLKQILRYHINVKAKNQNGIEKVKNNSNTEDKNITLMKNRKNNKSGGSEISTKESHALKLPNVIVNCSDPSSDIDENIEIEKAVMKIYNPFSINPSDSGALSSPLVELISLSNHFHPSVALFAKNILTGTTINYTGDPLEDLSLIRFLDRYVFKNPKKYEKRKIVPNDPLAVRVKYMPKGLRALSVCSQVYLNESEDQIPVDELFLYRYLRKNKNEMKSEEGNSDNESINSDEFDNLLSQLSGNKEVEELDFASDIQLAKKKKRKVEEVDNESGDDDDEEIENISDDNVDSNDDECIDFKETDDISDIEFNEEDDNDSKEKALQKSIRSTNQKNKNNGKKQMLNKGMKTGVDNIFMSVEEFSKMLEEQDKSKHKQGRYNHAGDVDGASVKQLDWERRKNVNSSRKFRGKTNKGFNIKNEDFVPRNKSTKKLKMK